MFTCKKKERLSDYKLIKELRNNSSFILNPFIKCDFLFIDNKQKDKYNVKFLIRISKKKLKKAINRNLIKRYIREIFRLNKHILNISSDKILLLQIKYLENQSIPFCTLQDNLNDVFHRLKNHS